MGPREVASLGAVAGAKAVLDGIRLSFGRPDMRRKLTKAFLLNGIFFFLLLALMIWGALALTAGLVEGELWLAALGWIARVLLIVGIVAVAPGLYSLIGDIVLPVVHGRVFEAAREHAGGPPVDEVGGVGKEIRTVGVDLRRLARFLGVSLVLLLANLIPVVGNLVYPVAQFLVTAHTMGWDLLAYHFELHDVRYDEQKRFLADHRTLVLAAGAAATVLTLLPVVQLVFITTNVAGAGVLSARLDGANSPIGGVSG